MLESGECISDNSPVFANVPIFSGRCSQTRMDGYMFSAYGLVYVEWMKTGSVGFACAAQFQTLTSILVCEIIFWPCGTIDIP